MENQKYNVVVNGKKRRKRYADICHDLEIDPSVHFVLITNRQTISCTVGKPDEIRYLRKKCEEKGYAMSRALKIARV